MLAASAVELAVMLENDRAAATRLSRLRVGLRFRVEGSGTLNPKTLNFGLLNNDTT